MPDCDGGHTRAGAHGFVQALTSALTALEGRGNAHIPAHRRAGVLRSCSIRETVIHSARELGLDIDVRSLDCATASTREAAGAVGCSEAEIVKSVVFLADGEPVLCIASGGHRVDSSRLAEALDAAEVCQASPDQVRAATGFAVGGVPPIGHDLRVVLDEALLEHERVWAAAGDGHSLFSVDPRELERCTGAFVAPVGA